jgi:predicted DNA binding CopG/RHH family protein
MRKKINYSDKNWHIGEQVKDFLPAPKDLVLKEEKEKITIEISRNCLMFFKREAKRQKVPYQRMIRVLLDEYVKRYQG